MRPGGQPNLQEILKQAQKMQEQMLAAQKEMEAIEVTGSAGGGLVTAVMSASRELRSVTIDPKAVDPDDLETLQDLIVAAVRDAARAANQVSADKVGPMAGGLGDALGGLGGLGGLPGPGGQPGV